MQKTNLQFDAIYPPCQNEQTSTKRDVLRRKLGKRPADPLICIPHGIPDVTCFRVVIAKVGHRVGANLDGFGRYSETKSVSDGD